MVIASKGYPGKVEDNKTITIDHSLNLNHVIFAGVSQNQDGLISKGNRVMMVKAQADTVEDCREQVYSLINKVSIDQSIFRTDIGL